jgi:phenylacetate-CoA ligase
MNDRLHFQPEIETLAPERLREIQLERFRRTLARAVRHSPFYGDLYRHAGLEVDEIRSLEDVRRVPLLDRAQIQALRFRSPGASEGKPVKELHATAGSRSWKSFLVGATQHDIDYWADLNARSLWMVGLRPGEVLLNAFPMGLVTWGFGLHYGALKLGVISLPAGSQTPESLVELMEDAGVAGFCGTPSKALNLARFVERRKVDLKERSQCRKALLGAEPWSWAIRERIEASLGLRAYDHYGMSELLGPGMACECDARDRKFGMHTWADAFLCECLDPRTEVPVADGEEGELVWTSLAWEGTPLIRYRSRDLSAVTWAPCQCGRTHPRLAAIKGRTDDAVTLEGIIVYPSQVEESLLTFEEAGSQFRIVVDRDRRGGEFFMLRVELKDRSYLEDEAFAQGLARKMRDAVRHATGIAPREVELVAPGSLRKSVGSEEKTVLVRVEDRRGRE